MKPREHEDTAPTVPREPIEISDEALERARRRGPERNRQPRQAADRMKAFF